MNDAWSALNPPTQIWRSLHRRNYRSWSALQRSFFR